MSCLIFTLRSGRQWPSAFSKQIQNYFSADIRAGSMVRYSYLFKLYDGGPSDFSVGKS